MVIRALDRKLLRDLMHLRMQAVAIALVVASGVAVFVATVTAYRALRLSEIRYYEQSRFAHVWVHLARAPESVLRDVTSSPGVSAVEGRLVAEAILDVPGIAEPATALLISTPATAGHAINDLYLRQGRHVERGKLGEVLVNEPFAEKNGLRPGDAVVALVAGRRIPLQIAGVVLSLEFVMQIPPGAVGPDDRRFAIFWMEREALASIVDLRGAVNDIVLRLAPGASEARVIADLDRLLEPYGGHGAYGRANETSHKELENHIVQLQGLSLVIPVIFLVVAAFLVNVVLARIVGTQQAHIGTLKAFGYSHAQLAAHYLALAFAMVIAGILVGIPVGVWLGRLMAEYYATFFRFPVLVFRIEPAVIATAALVTSAASLAGVWGTLLRVASLRPSVAMSVSAPNYRPTRFDQSRVFRSIAPSTRMIVRNMTRRPLRTAFTAAGMSLAVAVLVLGGSSADSLHRMIEVQFQAAQREDLSVVLAHRRSLAAASQFLALPGVRLAEPYRVVPARLHVRSGSQDVTLIGLTPRHTLRRIANPDFQTVTVPVGGALLNRWVAGRLGIHRGETVAIEIREDRRRVITPRVVGFVDEPIGSSIYLDLETLDRYLGEPQTFTAVHLLVDPSQEPALYATLKRAPQALAVQNRRDAQRNFSSMADASMNFIRQVEVIFSVIIAFGVVYNAARIALAERSHELATLRILGFSRREISWILLGEIGLCAAVAVPTGFVIGYGLSSWVVAAMSNERFRMPLIVQAGTYGFALVVFVTASLASALIVRRRLDHLDLIEVLKARE